jgi:DNA-binding response OmpR family regulator
MQPSPKRRVLIIDDEESIRTLLEQFLTLKGCEAMAVGTFDEALRAVAVTPPDLVVSDLTLGDSDGLALVAELRDRLPEVPILLLTGVSFDPEVIRDTILARVDAYLHKTAPLHEIYGEIRRLLDRGKAIQ